MDVRCVRDIHGICDQRLRSVDAGRNGNMRIRVGMYFYAEKKVE